MKVNVKKHTMMYPAPAVVASAYDEEGKADACTLAFATVFSSSSGCNDCYQFHFKKKNPKKHFGYT